MSPRHTPLEQKLGTFIRMLASERDGEVVAAARAIVRTLKGAGADIHVLAERVEKANGGELTEAEMRKLYDAGYGAGVRAAEAKQHGPSDFYNVDGTPAWRSRASASTAAIDCERRSADSSTIWRREQSGASQPNGKPNGCAASSTDSEEAFERRSIRQLRRRECKTGRRQGYPRLQR